MELSEASEILTYLAAGFPLRWRNAPARESQLWVEFLETLDGMMANEVAKEIVRNASDMPSIAEFRSLYGRLSERVGDYKANQDAAYANDPKTPKEWENQAQAHREWRKSNHPEIDDPAEGTPLPRNRLDFNREWGMWFKLKFGWTPEQAAKELMT